MGVSSLFLCLLIKLETNKRSPHRYARIGRRYDLLVISGTEDLAGREVCQLQLGYGRAGKEEG